MNKIGENNNNLKNVGLKWQPFLLPDESETLTVPNYEKNSMLYIYISKYLPWIEEENIRSENQVNKNTQLTRNQLMGDIEFIKGNNYKPIYSLYEAYDDRWLNKFVKVIDNYKGKVNDKKLRKVLNEAKLFFQKNPGDFLSFFLRKLAQTSSNKTLFFTSPTIYNGDVQSVVEFLGKIHENKWYRETYSWITLEDIKELIYSGIKFIPSEKLDYFAKINQPVTESVSISSFFDLIERKPEYLSGDIKDLFKALSEINQLSKRDKKIIELEKQLVCLCLDVNGKNNPYGKSKDKMILEERCNRRGRFLVGCLANSRYPEILSKLLLNKAFISNVLYIPHRKTCLFDGFDAIIYCISNAKDDKQAKEMVEKVINYFEKHDFEKYKGVYVSEYDLVKLFEANSALYGIVQDAIGICSDEVIKPTFNNSSAFLQPTYRFCDADGEKDLNNESNQAICDSFIDAAKCIK